MFWGLKITSGNQYKSLVEKSFHVSHAVLEPCSQNRDYGTVEVHIVLHKVDYIVCLLTQTCPQQTLNLEISEGEEMTVYVKTTTPLEACVHLTGFHIMEEPLESQWEGDDDLWEDEEVTSGEEEDTNEGLTEILLDGEFPCDEEDNDYVMEYPSLSHLETFATDHTDDLEEEEDDIDGTTVPSKRKRVSNKKQTEKLKKRKVEAAKETSVDSWKSNSKGKEQLKKKLKKKEKMSSERSQEVTNGGQEVAVNDSQEVVVNDGLEVTNGGQEVVANDSQEVVIDGGLEVTNDSQKVTNDSQKVKNTSKETMGSVIQENCTRTLRCGVDVEELKYGTGKIAKRGARVTIRYSGHSTGDNPVHDTLGKDEKPLCFTIGKKEVMSGLEQAIRGMRVGGCRRVVIPPSQRREGDVPSDIPDDANICLDVTLLSIK